MKTNTPIERFREVTMSNTPQVCTKHDYPQKWCGACQEEKIIMAVVEKKVRHRVLKEAIKIFEKHKDKPMTGKVVILELEVLRDFLSKEEK